MEATSLETLDFEAPAGERTHRGFLGITVDGTPSLWWSMAQRRWIEFETGIPGGITNVAPCRTLKAFRRHLRRHASELSGRAVVLSSRWKGHDVTARPGA